MTNDQEKNPISFKVMMHCSISIICRENKNFGAKLEKYPLKSQSSSNIIPKKKILESGQKAAFSEKKKKEYRSRVKGC